MKTWKWLIIVSTVILTGTFPSQAILQTVIYSDFGSGLSYSTATAWGVSGTSVSGGYRGQAQFFTPTITCDLSQIELATYHVGGSSLCNYFIAQDNGSGVPGTILESFNNVSTPTGLLTINSILDPVLTAGTEYWLCMEPSTATSQNAWYFNSQNVQSGFAFERLEWSWAPIGSPAPASGAFQIVGIPVPTPEPTVTSMLALGVIGFSGLRAFPAIRRQWLARA